MTQALLLGDSPERRGFPSGLVGFLHQPEEPESKDSHNYNLKNNLMVLLVVPLLAFGLHLKTLGLLPRQAVFNETVFRNRLEVRASSRVPRARSRGPLGSQ